MRIALLSDIHANLEALDACLKHARARGVDDHALLGDFVGYGADAAAVVDLAIGITGAGGIAVKGNHDAAIERHDSYFNDQAQSALEWARCSMSARQKRFLSELPLDCTRAPSYFVHASAVSPERWDYVDCASAALRSTQAAGQTYVFCGHTHDQRLYFETLGGRMSEFRPVPGTAIPVRGSRRWLAVVGSVGQPRDRNPAAAYAIFDDVKREITFFRVVYDHHAAAAKIRRAGLPAGLAYRVEAGI